MSLTTEELAGAVARHRWYHTLELAPGIVTEGMFDHRATAGRFLIPDDLAGLRCLDVGTMDGFWAFEMERRGAAEVIAADVAQIDDLDWPPRWRARVEPSLDAAKAERFALAHGALGSKVVRVERSVYDLGADLGAFDVIFCGDLLTHLKDPITALQRMRGVCRGSTIIANPVKRLGGRGRGRPLVEFDGIDEFRWWLLSEAALERMLLAVGFDRLEVGARVRVPPRAGGRWKGTRAVMRAFVA